MVRKKALMVPVFREYPNFPGNNTSIKIKIGRLKVRTGMIKKVTLFSGILEMVTSYYSIIGKNNHSIQKFINEISQ